MSAFLEMNSTESADDGRPMNEINTTPLVDVMLVLLIVFMITIPVITHNVPVALPHVRNEATKTKPENINISVNKEGQIYWGTQLLDNAQLLDRFAAAAVLKPQPEIHIRADQEVRYESVGRVIYTIQRGGVVKVGFLTEPDRGIRGVR